MKKRKSGGYIALVLAIAFVGVIAVSVTSSIRNALFPDTESYSAEPENNIAIVSILGEIGSGSFDAFGNPTSSYVHYRTLEYIYDLTKSTKNRGIFLYIDSPGGTVFETAEVYQALTAYRAVTGRPVIAFAQHTMASGAYYVACAAEKIYANPSAIVGSIGVYIQHFDLSGYYEKLGLSTEYIKTGENKAMGNEFEPLTDEQRDIYQKIVDENFEQFLNVIIQARGYEKNELLPLADGRIYSVSQAVDHGLLDGAGSYGELLSNFQSSRGAANIYYRTYNTNSFLSFLGSLSQARSQTDEERMLAFLESVGNGRPMYYYAG